MPKYAEICTIYAGPTSMDIKRKYTKICAKYANICKICSYEFYMQNMQKLALPPLLKHWNWQPGLLRSVTSLSD